MSDQVPDGSGTQSKRKLSEQDSIKDHGASLCPSSDDDTKSQEISRFKKQLTTISKPQVDEEQNYPPKSKSAIKTKRWREKRQKQFEEMKAEIKHLREKCEKLQRENCDLRERLRLSGEADPSTGFDGDKNREKDSEIKLSSKSYTSSVSNLFTGLLSHSSPSPGAADSKAAGAKIVESSRRQQANDSLLNSLYKTSDPIHKTVEAVQSSHNELNQQGNFPTVAQNVLDYATLLHRGQQSSITNRYETHPMIRLAGSTLNRDNNLERAFGPLVSNTKANLSQSAHNHLSRSGTLNELLGLIQQKSIPQNMFPTWQMISQEIHSHQITAPTANQVYNLGRFAREQIIGQRLRTSLNQVPGYDSHNAILNALLYQQNKYQHAGQALPSNHDSSLDQLHISSSLVEIVAKIEQERRAHQALSPQRATGIQKNEPNIDLGKQSFRDRDKKLD